MSPTGNEVKQKSTQFSNIRKYPKEYLGFLTTQGYLRQKATNPQSKGKTRGHPVELLREQGAEGTGN